MILDLSSAGPPDLERGKKTAGCVSGILKALSFQYTDLLEPSQYAIPMPFGAPPM